MSVYCTASRLVEPTVVGEDGWLIAGAMLRLPSVAPRCCASRPSVRHVHTSAALLSSSPSLPRYVYNRPSAAPSPSGVTVCRFPTGSGLHAPGDKAMQRCRRQWQGVAMNVYAKQRPAALSTAASPWPPPAARSGTASRTRRSASDDRLLPAPPRLPPPSSLLHVSVLSSKRRVSRLAPLRNRARRRLTAALMSALNAGGARGGLDVWVDATLAAGLVSAHWLRAEAEEAMRAIGALQPQRSLSQSNSQPTMWKQRLLAVAASRETDGGLTSVQPPSVSAAARLAATPLPVAMQLAIALHSHCSPRLSGPALLSPLARLCSAILQPPVSALYRHSGSFPLLLPYTSRRHKHTQLRQLRQCIGSSTDTADSRASRDESVLGVRKVEECVRWLSEREGEERQEVAAVLCEARVWLSYIVQLRSDSNSSSNIKAQTAMRKSQQR